MRVIPLEIEALFESIRDNNKFTIVGGQPVWQSNFHDEEFELFKGGRVVDENGVEYRLKYDGSNWSTNGGSGIFTPEYMFYECGSIREVVGIVKTEVGAKKNSRFPMALLETLDKPYNRVDDVETEFDFRMYLVVYTDEDYSPKERLEVSYEDKLSKWLTILERYLYREGFLILNQSDTYRERWGRNGLYGHDDNVFDEMVDALEITMQLRYLEACN